MKKPSGLKMILTDEIKEYLLKTHEHKTVAKMADELNVSHSKICNWLSEMGIIKKRSYTIVEDLSEEFFKHDINLATI